MVKFIAKNELKLLQRYEFWRVFYDIPQKSFGITTRIDCFNNNSNSKPQLFVHIFQIIPTKIDRHSKYMENGQNRDLNPEQ